MKLKTLTLALLATTIPTTGVFAAALDRSGQSISAFLQPDNYFEAGISILDPTVEGQEAGVLHLLAVILVTWAMITSFLRQQ